MSDTARCETCKGDKAITVKTHSSEEIIKDCPDCTEPAPSAGVDESRIRNIRAWNAARADVLSGADTTVAICDELLSARARIAALEGRWVQWNQWDALPPGGEYLANMDDGTEQRMLPRRFRMYPVRAYWSIPLPPPYEPAKEQGEAG